MRRARVYSGCRDCRKCMNPAVANAGRNAGRLLAGVSTGGLSELAMGLRGRCRVCGHQLSLHEGAGAPGPQPVVEMRAEPLDVDMSATPVPAVIGPTATAGPPPGWYLDPDGSEFMRWWDGADWTEHLTPMPEPPTAPTPGVASTRPAARRRTTKNAAKRAGTKRSGAKRSGDAQRDKNRAAAAVYDFGDDDPRDGSELSRDIKSIQQAFTSGVISQRKYRERLRRLREFHARNASGT